MQALGVAVVGFGWMGRVHTRAYLRVPHHFPQLEVRPELVAVADEVPGRAEEAAARYGFATASRDWRTVATDPRVRAVSITAPNFLHREIGTAMAEAGKHIWIEKPVGLTAADARAVAEAAARAGVQGTVGFNYRNAPAVAAARELIRSGEIGSVTHVRIRLLSDYAAHPEGALTWRYERERGGSGVLGDLASHQQLSGVDADAFETLLQAADVAGGLRVRREAADLLSRAVDLWPSGAPDPGDDAAHARLLERAALACDRADRTEDGWRLIGEACDLVDPRRDPLWASTLQVRQDDLAWHLGLVEDSTQGRGDAALELTHADVNSREHADALAWRRP